MRSNQNTKKGKRNTKFGTFTKVWSIIYFLVVAVFIAQLLYSDLLPDKYLYMALGAVAVITLITFPALFFRNFKKSRKIICLIMSLILTVGYAFGIIYMSGTLDFFTKITSIGEETEDYYVLVRNDDIYGKVNDISGQTVQTYTANDLNYSDAKNQLQQKADINYAMVDSLSSLADGLVDETYNVIFISAAHYTTICDEHDTFKDDTKILCTVKVKAKAKDISKNVDVTKESFNVYISGLDVEGTIDTTSRSDVNMIATVNPLTKTVLLTSIPRDYMIQLPSKENAIDKLTHTGIYGISETVGSVENLLGIDINYYVKVNYTTVTKLIDAIGGIDVDSDYTFTTSGMAASGLSGITFYEGPNHLTGTTALAFARERHSFEDGDVQRNKNQQKIMKAIIKKGTSSQTILTKYSSILNAIEDNVELNMSSKDIKKLIKMQLNDMSGWKIRTQNIAGTIDSAQCYSTGDYFVSVMDPDKASIVASVDKMVSVMEKQPSK